MMQSALNMMDFNSPFIGRIIFYHPNKIIIPVDYNEHQRIDDASTNLISYNIQSLETMGFALLHMNYFIVLFKRHNLCLS